MYNVIISYHISYQIPRALIKEPQISKSEYESYKLRRQAMYVQRNIEARRATIVVVEKQWVLHNLYVYL